MADNHMDQDYMGDDSFGEHYAEDPELAAIKARVHELEMEEESERLREDEQSDAIDMQLLTSSPRLSEPKGVELCLLQAGEAMHPPSGEHLGHFNVSAAAFTCASSLPDENQKGPFYNMTPEERMDADNRSVYVGNVDYGATADELEIHFNGCGPVNRVTILCDRFSGHPKGFAYIEFSDRESVDCAIGLHETLFRGRVLKVLPKRTNMPGISTTDRGGHRGGPPRGRARGFRPPRYPSSSRGRFRYQTTRPQHQNPHPYYGGPPVGKRQWGHMDYHEQVPKRYPCLLLITPPSEELGAGSAGHHYPHQR